MQPNQFDGRQYRSGYSRSGRGDFYGNNNGRYSPRHDSSWSANEFTVNILDRTPPDQPIQSHQHQRDPMAKAGPSRLPREAPKPSGSPPIARIWGRPSRDDPASGANSINISQADPSPDSRNFREDLEQTHPIDDVQAAECSVSPATIEQEDSRSPSLHWEDHYEQHEEPAPLIREHFLKDTQTRRQPTNEALASASTLNNGRATMRDSAEPNPWAYDT